MFLPAALSYERTSVYETYFPPRHSQNKFCLGPGSTVYFVMFSSKSAAIILALSVSLSLSAQEPTGPVKQRRQIEPLRRPFVLSYSAGGNFNMGGNPYPAEFGTRPDVAPQTDMRFNFTIAPHWSIYADLGISFFRIETEDTDLGDILVDIFLPGIRSLQPYGSAGFSYMAEKNRWLFMPRAGAGLFSSTHSSKSSTSGDVEHKYEVDMSAVFLEAGVSAGYRLTDMFALFVDVAYRYPLTPCRYLHASESQGETVVETCESRWLANDLTVSFGVQFQFEMGRRRR